MGAIHQPTPVKLIVGMLTGIAGLEARVRKELASLFGPVDYQSPILEFNFTDYYRPEMGEGLKRIFFSFEKLIDPSHLAAIKVQTNAVEARYQNAEWNLHRPVNLDPGYLEQGKLVLASTKNFYHRIYLDKGIYAELTLIFRKGRYQCMEWTYPDYRTEPYHRFFHQVRDIYRQQLTFAFESGHQ